MDPTAIAHCMEHDLPILVFNYRVDGNIERAVRGEDIGTRVSNDDSDDPKQGSRITTETQRTRRRDKKLQNRGCTMLHEEELDKSDH